MTLLCGAHTFPKCQGDKSSANEVCKSCFVRSVRADEAGYVESMEVKAYPVVEAKSSHVMYAKAPKNLKLSESSYVEEIFGQLHA